MLIEELQLGVQRPLVLGPVGEDVSHRAAAFVKANVEAVGVDLRTVCDLKHRLKANALLSCIKEADHCDAKEKELCC